MNNYAEIKNLMAHLTCMNGYESASRLDDASFLRLLQLADSALPVGAGSHSFGIETDAQPAASADAADARAADLRRAAPSGELREFLYRKSDGAGAGV